MSWAKNESELANTWRKRIKYDLLVQKMEKTPEKEAKEKLLRRYRSFGKLHAWDQQMHVTQWKYKKGPDAR